MEIMGQVNPPVAGKKRSRRQSTPVAAPPLHLPAQFDSDSTLLDMTVVGQHQLYRHIQSTNWSRKRGLAGRSIEDLRVVEVARRGA